MNPGISSSPTLVGWAGSLRSKVKSGSICRAVMTKPRGPTKRVPKVCSSAP